MQKKPKETNFFKINDTLNESNESFLPTNESSNSVSISNNNNLEKIIYPTDEIGREIRPVLFFNGTVFSTDPTTHAAYNPQGQLIKIDDDNNPLGPDNKPLKKNNDGNFVYPPLDKYGEPMPTDSNFRPIYSIVNKNGIEFLKNVDGLNIDNNEKIFPTDLMGKPIGPEGSPLPTDFYSRFIVSENTFAHLATSTVLPTDELGYPIHPIVNSDGQLLSTTDSGQYINSANGEEFKRNDQGFPIDINDVPFPTNSNNEFIFIDKNQVKSTITTNESLIIISNYSIVDLKGILLPKDSSGRHIDSAGVPIPTELETQQPVDKNNIILPKDLNGNYISNENNKLNNLTNKEMYVLKLNNMTLPINVDENVLIPTNYTDTFIAPDNLLLPTNTDKKFVVEPEKTTLINNRNNKNALSLINNYDKFVYPVINESKTFLNNKLLATNATKIFNKKSDKILSTSANGLSFVDADNFSLSKNIDKKLGLTEDVTINKIETFSTNKPNLIIYPSVDNFNSNLSYFKSNISLNKNLLLTNNNSNIVNKNGILLPINKINKLKKDQIKHVFLPTDNSRKNIYSIIDKNDSLLLKNKTKNFISSNNFNKSLYNDDKIFPTNFTGFYIFKESITKPLTIVDPIINTTTKLFNNLLNETSILKQQNIFAFPNDNQISEIKPKNICYLNEIIADIIIAINNDLLNINNIELIKKTIKRFIELLNLEPDQSRLSFLHYGLNVEIPVNLGGYHEKEEILNQINNLIYNQALGLPNLKIAYRAAYQQFESFGRKDVQKLMIIFSSGKDLYVLY